MLCLNLGSIVSYIEADVTVYRMCSKQSLAELEESNSWTVGFGAHEITILIACILQTLHDITLPKFMHTC